MKAELTRRVTFDFSPASDAHQFAQLHFVLRDFDSKAGSDTSPFSKLNLSSRVPVTTQLIPLIHSEMLKLSWKGD